MVNLNKEKTEERDRVTKKDVFLIFFIILLLSGISYWQLKNWRKSLSEIELPKFEMPEYEPFPKEEGYREWISPDRKLKINYRADWMEMEKKIFEGVFQEDKTKTLFFAQKFDFEKATQSFLAVQELNVEVGREIEEIVEEMKKDVEEKEGEMEILSLEIEDKIGIFEATYLGEAGFPLHSKEKIILTEEKVYLVTFSTFEKNWLDFQQESEEIINSAILVE